MNTVICTPEKHVPGLLADGHEYFSMFSGGRNGISSVGTGLLREVDKAGIIPGNRAWDFLTFALAVSAADLTVSRSFSADGWTRTIKLCVSLIEPDPFVSLVSDLERMLGFLTGDYWQLSFDGNGLQPPRPSALKEYDADCVSLLSGGVDSLVGAIDLSMDGRHPIFVSQIAKGDSATQLKYARVLGGEQRHLQWNHNIRVIHSTERSTRGRSIIFFAFAAIAASAIGDRTSPIEIFVPENGLISLNIPLNAGRVGSLSTKTTHPIFLDSLQRIWYGLGLNLKIVRPYAFLTKGELLARCKDIVTLGNLIGESTSCGRYGYYNYTHCGRCVPCLVRRAAFLNANLKDTTSSYHFPKLHSAGRKNGANDIGAVASAVLRCRNNNGLSRFIAGQLSFAEHDERVQYEGVVDRGMKELGALLIQEGVL